MTLSDVISKRTVFGKDATLTGNASISGRITAKSTIVNDNGSTDAVRITQTGTGNALVVEDSANPDATPFAVTATGDVGIGTTAPSQKLEVRGNINTFRTETDGTALILNNASSGGKSFSIISTGSVNSSGAGNLEFFASSGGNYVLNTSGNTGIGTASPARKLHVNGTVRLQGLPTYANNAAAIAGGLAVGDLFIANVSGEGQLRIVI
jgi:hypothetical protein